jgi:hypothetical protein
MNTRTEELSQQTTGAAKSRFLLEEVMPCKQSTNLGMPKKYFSRMASGGWHGQRKQRRLLHPDQPYLFEPQG